MSKSTSQKNKHTHIPTHIGSSVIALVALVLGLFVVTQYNAGSQTENVKSEAATISNSSPQCISYNTSGKCVLYQKTTTTVNTNSPCLSYNTSGKCTYYKDTKQNTTTYVPTIATNKQPASQQTSTTKKTTTPNYGQSSTCKSIGGTCESTSSNASGGSFHSGLCPGPATWQCFVPNSSKSTSGTNPAPGTSYVVCHNGKMVADGGYIATNTQSTIAQFCSQYPNNVYINGKIYSCSNIPTAYKSVAAKVCS